MSLEFDVSIKGIEKAASDVEGVGERAVHAAPAFAKIMALLLEAERKLWRRHGGKKWPPRAESTQANDPGGSLLHRTGTLESSLTGVTAADAIREVSPVGMKFGTSDWTARVLTGGTKDGRIPARPLLISRYVATKAARQVILEHVLGHDL